MRKNVFHGDRQLRLVKGTKDYLENFGEKSGVVEIPDATVCWWILGEGDDVIVPHRLNKETGRPMTKADKRKRQRGLCGKRGTLAKTLCCGRLICDDEANYKAFSFARNSCDRNHRRCTLCGYQHTEEHRGEWGTCDECRGSFETEMYVWYGTNTYNFEKLVNPPSFEPTLCASCRSRINLGEDGYTLKPSGEYLCESCFELPA